MRNETVTAQSPTDNSARQPQAFCRGLAHAATPQQQHDDLDAPADRHRLRESR